MMKFRQISLIIIVLFILLSIPIWFVYTRFCLDRYTMNGNTITYKNYVYTRKDSLPDFNKENIGKTIGISIDIKEKRTITDYIWPFWVMEYKDDKEHNRIFIIGLMDLGNMYEKDSK